MSDHPLYESLLWAGLPQKIKKAERDRLHAELRSIPEIMTLFYQLPDVFDHTSPIFTRMCEIDIPFKSQIVDFSRILKSTKDMPGEWGYYFLCKELRSGENVYAGNS